MSLKTLKTRIILGFKTAVYIAKHGTIDAGFYTRKSWKDKSYWGWHRAYYDGDLLTINVWYFNLTITW